MERIITSVMLAASILQLSAQEQTDTIKVQHLNEVVVEARMQKTSATSTSYIPTGKQKNAAQNAIDLLQHMAIPQIRINPKDESVTDNMGGNVAIYINFLEASKEEMEGLRTADVRRVEYLEFPTDPRFRGAERVINIIVQEYAYGGYTKLTANENFLIGLSSRVNFFSKFTYKKMTYDLYAGLNNWDSHHMGKSTEGTYLLAGNDGTPYSITRKETLQDAHYKKNQYPVTFRATYNSKKVQIRNLLAFSHLNMPANDYSGELSYSPNTVNGYVFEQKNPNRSNSLSYSGTYFFALPKNFSIDISPIFNYTHSNDYTEYMATAQPDIYRHAKENAYYWRINAYLRKKFGKKHSIMVGGNGGDVINRLTYTGNDGFTNRFHNAFAAGMLGYNFASKNTSVNIDAGFLWEGSDINGQKHNDIYPFTHISARYSLNPKNMLSAYFQYATNSPGISEKSSDILKDNELMYISGNPLLENSRHTTVYLNYTWLLSNAFSMNAYGKFFGIYDRMLLTYAPYQDGKTLLRTYINDGDYLNGEIGIAANCKLFNGKLQLYANPKQAFYKSTGMYSRTYHPFQITAQATLYLGSFYFRGYYDSPQKSMFTASPRINHGTNFHSVTAGWANSNWNLRIMAANFFNKGWESAVNETVSPYYSEHQTLIGTTCHPRINLTATYTFGYGKHIKRGNEVGEQSGASSAILK